MMTFTELTWKLFILFLPGIISFSIYRHVSGIRPMKIFKFLIYSVVWGVFDYAMLEITYFLVYDINISELGTYLPVWQFFRYEYAEIPFYQTVFAIGLGAVMAFLIGRLSACVRQMPFFIKFFYRNCHSLDLWDYTLNSEVRRINASGGDNRVVILDYRNGYRYEGVVKSFSSSGKKREIVLSESTTFRINECPGQDMPTKSNGKNTYTAVKSDEGFYHSMEKPVTSDNAGAFDGKTVYLSLVKGEFSILFPG